jgi:C1A family cysteine protease
MNIKELLVYILLILTIILLLKYLNCNCNCIEGLETDKEGPETDKDANKGTGKEGQETYKEGNKGKSTKGNGTKKNKLKSIKKHHSNKEYNKLINQVINVNKHDVDKVHKENINKGVKPDHPFAGLPPAALKYLVAFPKKTKGKSKNIKPKNALKPKVIKETFENSPKTYTNDINHELGDVRNQGQIGICWAITIVEALDSAYYNQTGNIFRTSIQQLMDCLVELDGVDYDNLYFGLNVDTQLLYIQKFYRDSQRNIYSEEEYPSILDSCNIPDDVDELTFCSDCNNLYDISFNDPTDTCETNITSGVFSCETDLCNDCEYAGYCNKQCGICSDNICNNNDNNGCDTFPDSNGNTCTIDIQNRCIQQCRTGINPGENITVSDIISLNDVNDKTLYNNLLNNTLRCVIYVTEDMMYFDSTNCYVTFDENSDTDPNLFWNPDTIENNDPNIYDLDNNSCLDYGNYGWCCPVDDDTCNDTYFGINTPFCQKLDDDKQYRELDPSVLQENCDGNWISDASVLPTWTQTEQFCKNTCIKKAYRLNHAVIIVGSVYKTNESLPQDKRSTSSDGRYFWVLRNSWGPDWGDNGHFYVERDVNDERFNGNACLLSIYIDISYITLNIE